MLIYSDESGDFAFPDGLFDCYSQATVICPDSCLSGIEDWTAERIARWDLSELHGHELTDEQIREVCQFIESTHCVLLAMVTDTELITRSDISRFRLAQAAGIQRSLERYWRHGGTGREIEYWSNRNLKRSGLQTRISDNEFVQAHLLMLLIREALQKAVLWYQDEDWDSELADFQFVVDAKLPGKQAAGEKYLSEIIVPGLASQGASFDLPATWQTRPDHPFLARFNRETGRIRGREVKGVVDLRAIFKDRVEFADSQDHAGLQLADVVAHVVRRAVLEPENPAIQDSYDYLREKLCKQDASCLIVNRFRDSKPPGRLERYAPLWRPLSFSA